MTMGGQHHLLGGVCADGGLVCTKKKKTGIHGVATYVHCI